MGNASQGETLLKLVDLDKLLLQLDKQLSTLPQRPKLAELSIAYDQLADKAEQTAKLRLRQDMRIKALEEEALMIYAKIRENKAHIEANSSRYKEVSLLANEIEELSKRVEKTNFDASTLREGVERIATLENQINTRIIQVTGKQSDLRASLDSDIQRLEEQVEKLNIQRAKMVALLPEKLVQRYDKQRVLKKGIGATALEGRICGACRIELSEGQVVRTKREADSAGIGSCPTCHRLLVL
jgi:predicted  nucleic acid-binding Zn-ribbon protein